MARLIAPAQPPAAGKIDGFKMKGQADAPAKHRPVKPPGARSQFIRQKQGGIGDQITPQMPLKSSLATS